MIRPDGVGPIRVGMSLSQLSTTFHEKFSLPENKEDQGCFYVNPRTHPEFALMIENGHLVRIDVKDPSMPTSEGIHVGDTEAQLRRVYGSKLKVEPSQYTGDEGGHFLTVRSDKGRYGIRFETEQGRITEYYAGDNAIQYVEGCE
jgi:hypothetical protein